jgi:protein gp37
MADKTSIEWTDATWNPVRGCSVISPGCTNCYAMGQAHRHAHPAGAYAGLTKLTNGGPVWTGEIRLVPQLLEQPLKWKRPRRVFVNSMSDLFHEGVSDEFITAVWRTMADAPQHVFQILTKRPARMLLAAEARPALRSARLHRPPLRMSGSASASRTRPAADERISVAAAERRPRCDGSRPSRSSVPLISRPGCVA